MNIYKELNKIIEYIEENIEEKIEYKILSKMIGVDEYTFRKIFSVLADIPIAEYIRNRRLSIAGQELYMGNEKIVDIAIKYQYNNPTAFSRAFEKFHGMKPSEVKNNPEKLKLYTKLHFNETKEQRKYLEYKIIEKNKMTLCGKYKKTSNKDIGTDAPKFYIEISKQFGKPDYGLVEYKDRERENVKAYWIAYNNQQKGLEKIVIPKSKWIELRVESQKPKEIQNLSKIFYYEFLPSCKYNLKDLPEIEYYHNNITDFLIPIID